MCLFHAHAIREPAVIAMSSSLQRQLILEQTDERERRVPCTRLSVHYALLNIVLVYTYASSGKSDGTLETGLVKLNSTPPEVLRIAYRNPCASKMLLTIIKPKPFPFTESDPDVLLR